jgi:hypothetical protein
MWDNMMKKNILRWSRLILVCVALFSNILIQKSSFSAEIEIDAIKINIPAHIGFADVTKTAPDLVAFFKDLTPRANNLQAVFVSAADAGALLKSQEPLLNRYLLAQTTKTLESYSFTPLMFAEYRQGMRSQFEKFLTENKAYFDSDAKYASNNLSKTLEQAVDLKIGEAIQIPFDSESDNHIAFSVLSKLLLEIDNNKTEYVVACTSATVLLKGRLVNLYAYATYHTADDLEWTQKAMGKWVLAVVKANPSQNTNAMSSVSQPRKPFTSIAALISIKWFITTVLALLVSNWLWSKLRAKRPQSKKCSMEEETESTGGLSEISIFKWLLSLVCFVIGIIFWLVLIVNIYVYFQKINELGGYSNPLIGIIPLSIDVVFFLIGCVFFRIGKWLRKPKRR